MTDSDIADVPDETLDCQWLPRDEIEPNEWNPNTMDDEQKDHLTRSIVNHGWTRPIVIHADEHYIIDGEQRWTVAARDEIYENEDLTPDDVPAGYIPVFGITMDETDAKVSTIQHNRVRGYIDYENLYEYLGEFEQDGMLDEISNEIDLSRNDVDRIVNQETVSEAIAEEHDELTESWEPTDITEAEEGETASDDESERLREARDEGEALSIDRIVVSLTQSAEDHFYDVFGRENTAQNLYDAVKYIEDEELFQAFREFADIERDRQYMHPDHPYFGTYQTERPSDWDEDWDPVARELIPESEQEE